MNELLTKEEKRQQEELTSSKVTERFFGRTLTAPPLLNDQTPPPLTDAAVVQNMRRDLTKQADVQVQIEDTRSEDMPALTDALKSYKKAAIFGGDSEEFKAVQQQLERVTYLHSIPFTADKHENAKLALLAIDGYTHLIEACDAYVGKQAGALFKGCFSSAGRHRQSTARIIRAFAARDLDYLRGNARRIAETDGLSWGDVLQPAREESVTLTQSFGELKTIGGNSANNYILPGDPPVYLKKGEDATRSTDVTLKGKVSSSAKPEFMEIRRQIARETLAGEPGVDDALLEVLIKNDAQDYRPNCGLTPQQWAQYLPLLQKVEDAYSKQTTVNEQLNIMNVDVGKTLQISKRNVASSRVADLLGISCVARSRTMRVTDKNGKSVEGNGMDGAPGITLSALRKEYAADKPGSYDPRVIRQLADLQMFDAVVCQIDRNDGNILVERDKTGNVVGITGIDNDFAFPHTDTLRTLGEPQCPTFGTQKSDEGRTINIPHISLSVAQKLMALTEDTLRVSLIDVLEEEAITAEWGRIRRIQDIIGPKLAEELANPPASISERVFLHDSDWESGAKDFDQEKELGKTRETQHSYARGLQRALRGDVSGSSSVKHLTAAQFKEEADRRAGAHAVEAEKFANRVEWRRLGRADAMPNGWKPGMPTPPAPEA